MKFHLTALILLFSIPVVSALTCQTDTNPILYGGEGLQALCTVNDSLNNNCYTWLSEPSNDSNQWGAMPDKPLNIEGIGSINYFPVNGNVVNVKFSRDKLEDNRSITGNIRCGSEAVQFNFTPIFADYQEMIGEKLLWGAHNTQYIAAASILSIIIIIGIRLVWGAING